MISKIQIKNQSVGFAYSLLAVYKVLLILLGIYGKSLIIVKWTKIETSYLGSQIALLSNSTPPYKSPWPIISPSHKPKPPQLTVRKYSTTSRNLTRSITSHFEPLWSLWSPWLLLATAPRRRHTILAATRVFCCRGAMTLYNRIPATEGKLHKLRRLGEIIIVEPSEFGREVGYHGWGGASFARSR